mmetsp:Transcript_9908/g.23153  ORF Transcript_9908/g.23153 Transcript_9908/m.23153 type:complete len:251 (+) Transcript_9908:2401-3153(+)
MHQQPLPRRWPQGARGDDQALHEGALLCRHQRTSQAPAAAQRGRGRQGGGPVCLCRRKRHRHFVQVFLGGHQVGRLARAWVRCGGGHGHVPPVHPQGDPESGRVTLPPPPEPPAAPHPQGRAGGVWGGSDGRLRVKRHVAAARPVRRRRGGGEEHGRRVPRPPRRPLPRRRPPPAPHPGVVGQRLHAGDCCVRPQVYNNRPRANGGVVAVPYRLSAAPQGLRGDCAAGGPDVAQQRHTQQAVAHPPRHGV